jgi:ABC-type Fe3+-siderophore transport system permease subunit
LGILAPGALMTPNIPGVSTPAAVGAAVYSNLEKSHRWYMWVWLTLALIEGVITILLAFNGTMVNSVFFGLLTGIAFGAALWNRNQLKVLRNGDS